MSGRRPAGICAAALLIAARAHGFSRQHSDVTRILKVCGLTVTTRVREFEQTSSARLLSLEQFQKMDLETEGAFMYMRCTSLYRLLRYFTLSST